MRFSIIFFCKEKQIGVVIQFSKLTPTKQTSIELLISQQISTRIDIVQQTKTDAPKIHWQVNTCDFFFARRDALNNQNRHLSLNLHRCCDTGWGVQNDRRQRWTTTKNYSMQSNFVVPFTDSRVTTRAVILLLCFWYFY